MQLDELKMEVRALSQFIAVAEEKNIRRAALRLHISQPALTRNIRMLEEEVGAQLFARTSTGVEITDAGEALLNHASIIITKLAQAKKDVFRIAQNTRPQINVGVCGSASFTIIPQIIDLFTKNNPGVDVVLHSARKEQQIQALRHGKIIIAFDRFLHEELDIVCEEVASEPMLIAMNKNNPLKNIDSINTHDLQDELFIGPSDKSLDADLLRIFGFVPKIEKRADDLMNILAFVDNGYGIFFAPPSSKALPFKNVIYRKFIGSNDFSFKLHCIYMKNEKNQLLNYFLDAVHTFHDNFTSTPNSKS